MSEKRTEYQQRRRNRIIADFMIYGGIAILVGICIFVSAVIFLGQSGDAITDLVLDTEKLSLRMGHTYTLEVSTKPEGNSYAMQFTSSNSEVAQVTNEGVITAKNEGNTIITVSSGNIKKTCAVSVVRDRLDSLVVERDVIQISGGKEISMPAIMTPIDAKEKEIEYSSEDESIAVVDKDGTIKGVAEGQTVIYVRDLITGLSDSVTIIVTSTELPDSMNFKEEKVTLELGEIYKSELVFVPENITSTSAIYYTTDIEVASVTNEGIITAKGQGKCQIEAYYTNDNSLVAIMEVEVIDSFPIITP